jgi:spore coat polysaccharide biosynthesis protein SpsF (cytidylyltransferase family)
MAIDKELVQDVIDRMLKYGAAYERAIRELNKGFAVDYKTKVFTRKYENEEQEKKDSEQAAKGADGQGTVGTDLTGDAGKGLLHDTGTE